MVIVGWKPRFLDEDDPGVSRHRPGSAVVMGFDLEAQTSGGRGGGGDGAWRRGAAVEHGDGDGGEIGRAHV